MGLELGHLVKLNYDCWIMPFSNVIITTVFGNFLRVNLEVFDKNIRLHKQIGIMLILIGANGQILIKSSGVCSIKLFGCVN